jgi:hypothetical protein
MFPNVAMSPRTGNRTTCTTSPALPFAGGANIKGNEAMMTDKAEIEQWLAVRKEAALKIDPDTAEVDWGYGLTLDSYGVLDLPEEARQVQRVYWARSPGSDVWVRFDDLPDTVRKELWAKHRKRIAFPAGLGLALDSRGVPIVDSDGNLTFDAEALEAMGMDTEALRALGGAVK